MSRYHSSRQILVGAKRLCRPNSSLVQRSRPASAVAVGKDSFDDPALAKAKPFEEIPSHYIVPGIGTLWTILPFIGLYDLKKPHLAIFEKQRRFGNVFRDKMGPVHMVCSMDPDDMQVIFRQEGKYPSRGEFESLKAYRQSRKKWYTSLGLLILQGKEWHDLRSKTQKHLMKPKAVHAYLNPMQEVARDFTDKMRNSRDRNKEVPDFLNELYKWALESVALVGLDTRLGCLDPNLSSDSDGMRLINSVQTQFECMAKLEAFGGSLLVWKIFPTPTWRRFAKAGDDFTEIAFRYINRSLDDLKKNAASGDEDMTLLQSMLMTKGLDASGAMVMVADMLTAGIDTTSHSIGYLLYHLARNPDKQELLHQEITRLLPRKEDRITTDIFNEMKYLKACIKESQRLSPIVSGVARTFDHDVVFSGYRIPAGVIAVIGLHGIYTDEKYFSNPQKFLPERWLNKDDKFNPFAFVPFGVGPRSCIGRRLAELEIISLATEITRNFRVEYHHEDIGMVSRLINTPDKPLRYNFIER